jgi:hypothetical protein
MSYSVFEDIRVLEEWCFNNRDKVATVTGCSTEHFMLVCVSFHSQGVVIKYRTSEVVFSDIHTLYISISNFLELYNA